MNKLLIYNDSHVSDDQALHYVQTVINQGRISLGNSYCFATKFEGGIIVFADKLKSGDKFRVSTDHTHKHLLEGE